MNKRHVGAVGQERSDRQAGIGKVYRVLLAFAILLGLSGLLAGLAPGQASASAVSSVEFDIASLQAGESTTWVVEFTTTSTLHGGADTVTIIAPSGTTLPEQGGELSCPYQFVYDSGSHAIFDCPVVGNRVTLEMPSQGGTFSIPGGSAILVRFDATNPPAGTYDRTEFAVRTSSDTTNASPSGGFRFENNPATEVSGVSFAPSSLVGGGPAEWTVSFTTSAKGAMQADEETITLTAPVGTEFSTSAADYSVNGTAVQDLDGGGDNTVTLTVPSFVNDSASVTVVAGNVTNPPSSAEASEFAVATSIDTIEVAPADGIAFASKVGALAVSMDSQAEGAAASWTFEFTATTGLPADGTITLEGPDGATFSGAASDYTVNGTAVATVAGGGTNAVTLTLPGDFTAATDGGAVELIAAGTTNPPAGTYPGEAWTLSTSADPLPAALTAVVVFANEPATRVENVVFSPRSLEAGSTDNVWDVTFTTSAAGALRSDFGLETITVTAPEGTSFSVGRLDYVVNGSFPPSDAVVTPEGNSVEIIVPEDIAASEDVTIVIEFVTNPATGTYDAADFTVSTSVDTIPTAPSQGLTFDTMVDDVDLGINPPTAGSAAIWTWTFTATSSLSPGDTIFLTAPEGAVYSGDRRDYTVNGVVPAAIAGGGSAAVTLTLPGEFPVVSASEPVIVVARDTHNPNSGVYSGVDFSVATSVDTAPAHPDPEHGFHFAASVQDVHFDWNTLVEQVEATWTVRFTTSTGGALEEGDEIFLVAPRETWFSGDAEDYTVNGVEVDDVEVPDPDDLDGPFVFAEIEVPTDIGGGEQVTVVARDTENPEAGAYPNFAFSVATDWDGEASPASGATFIEPSEFGVSDLRFSPQVTLPEATTAWEISFVTGRSGVLDPGDAIAITAPEGTVFSSDVADYTVNGDVVTAIDASGENTVLVTVPGLIIDEEVVSVVAAGTTNPPRGLYSPAGFSVATTTDNVPVNPAAGLAFHTPPVAAAGPDQVVGSGATVTMNGNGSYDPDGNPVTYAWSFESKPAGSQAVIPVPNTARPSFVADAAGEYVLRLIVNDGLGDSAPDTVTVTAEPRPIASFTHSPTSDLTTGTNIQFTDTSTATGDAITGWSWDFGDGATSGAQHPEHQYDTPGIYHVYLQVTGENTGQSVRAHQVLLVGAPGAPIEGASFWTQPGDETIDATHLVDIQLTKRGPGTPVVTIASFDGQPVGEENAVFGAGSSFFDINLDSAEGVDAIDFTWSFGPDVDPADLILLWYDPEIGSWRVVHDQTVHSNAGGGGTLEVHLDHTTSPRVDQLTGTVFGAGTMNAITKVADKLTHGPNPASNSATFYFPSGPEGTLYVYDAAGRLVWSASVSSGATSRSWNLVSLDGEPLANGLYLYRLVREDGTHSDIGKLVILR